MGQLTPAEIIRFVRVVGFAQIAVGIVFQLIVIGLQIAAFRRHRQMSFLLLSVSTLCGILYLSMNLVIHFTAPKAMSFVWLYALGFLLFCLQGGLGLVGIAKLFQDYRELAENRVKAIESNRST